MEMDSDEELNRELEKAVKHCKKNKQGDGSKSNKKMASRGNAKINKNIKNDPLKKEMNLNTERNGNRDALMDVTELIHYFFLPKQIQNNELNINSYSEYEKQGAIPKSRIKNDSYENNRNKVMNLMARLKSNRKNHSDDKSISKETDFSFNDCIPIDQTLNPLCDNEIVKVSEETCLKPFFYIVPENPSPNFFLPRGSYYIIPEVPRPSTEENIVFHPERGARSKSKVEPRETSEVQSNFCVQLNNLGKDPLEKLDSHLNIGPQDVKLNESTYNLEINCTACKVFQKNFASSNNSKDSSTSSEENQFDMAFSCKGIEDDEAPSIFTIEQETNWELLDTLVQVLMMEFPYWSVTWTSYIAQKYLNDEAGLEEFVAAERKIRDQYESLRLRLPESDRSELLNKCREFRGNEALLNEYVEEVQLANRIHSRVTDMQFIFPDADPEFLFEEVRKLGDGDNELSMCIERLLESKNYPKIQEDHLLGLRRSLWKAYVVNFNVKNYVRNVPRPERFDGPDGNNNKEDPNLILKYLSSRYPSADVDFLQIFRQNNSNLTKTCDFLNEVATARPLGYSLQNEPFSEEFVKEICYIEHKREIEDFLNGMRELKELEKEDALLNGSFLSCPLCSDEELVASEVVPCPEGHVFCVECIKRYITTKIGDGVYKFVCPMEKCAGFFAFSSLESFLPEKILLNIVKKQQAEEVSSAAVEGLEFCPYCEFGYIPNPGNKIFKCQNPVCLMETCRNCRQESHIPLRCEELERSIDVEARKKIEETMTSQLVRTCPSCKKNIVKIDGCNKMSCSCGTLFCYVCRNKIKDYEHFKGGSKCPLYSNNEELHHRDVVAAGVRTRDEIIRENPGVRILYDPTNS